MPAAPPAGRDHLQILEPLAREPERVGGGRAHDDGRAVLVVVEHRDAHALAADALDGEAVGRLDVLQVDRPEGGLERADDLREPLGVALVHLHVDRVDPGEGLEEHRLALHHRLRGERADVAEPQHRGAVGDDRDEVGARGVARGRARVGRDLQARLGHARRVGAREVAAVGQGLRRPDLDLPGPRMLVVVERRLAQRRRLLAALVLVAHGRLPRSKCDASDKRTQGEAAARAPLGRGAGDLTRL